MKKSKKNKLKIMALDTEDDSKGTVKLIDFYDGDEHFEFFNQEKAVHWLLDRGTNLDIWCVNLQYDLINTFGTDLSILEINYVGSRIISAKLPGTKVFFKDTLNHWKISVKEMGKRIGLEKLEDDLFDENEIITLEKLRTRCQRDAEITYHFVHQMKARYEKFGASLKATIGSTALDYFNKKYFKFTKKRQIKTKDLEFMLEGYYGGRTEIFFNKPVEGNIQYFDFNSLYPSVMESQPFPIIGEKCYKRTKKPDFNNIGVISATVTSPDDLFVPYLPLRADNGGLIFPLGTFNGVWTYFELTEAIKLGYEINKIHTCLEFTRGVFYPFKDFINDTYTQRLAEKALKDDLAADAAKNLMNNLYGKYGQGRDFTQLIPLYDRGDIKPGDEVMGDMILREQQHDHFPVHTNMIWAMLTTAYGRHKMWVAMNEVVKMGGLLIYCDTDSIIFESDKIIFHNSDKLGELKSEGDFKYAHFKLPKLYHLIAKDLKHSYKAKGVPKKEAENFFTKGIAVFKRPYKLRECMRRNMSPKRTVKLIPNYWDTTQKSLNKKYDKRIVLKDGNTKPLTIYEES